MSWKTLKKYNLSVNYISPLDTVDVLCIDLEQIILESARKVYILDKDHQETDIKNVTRYKSSDLIELLLKQIIADLLSVVVAFAPSNTLFLAMDGVSNMAENMRKSDIYKEIMIKKDNRVLFDVHNLVAYTEITKSIHTKILNWIDSGADILPRNVIYSPFSVIGTANDKILTHLRFQDLVAVDQTCVIYTHVDNVIPYLITPYSLLFLTDGVERINIEQTRLAIHEKTNLYQYIILDIIFSNMFLPSPISLKAIDNPFFYLNESLIKENYSIWWRNLLILLKKYADIEPGNILKVEVEADYMTPLVKNKRFDFNVYRKLWYGDDNIEDMVINWLEMVYWTYNYYLFGDKNLKRDIYYRYTYAPLLIDIVNIGKTKIVSIVKSFENVENNDVVISEYLVSVMPASSFSIISKKMVKPMQNLMLKDSEINKYWGEYKTEVSQNSPHQDMSVYSKPSFDMVLKVSQLVPLSIDDQEYDVELYKEIKPNEEEEFEMVDPWEVDIF